MIQTADFFTPVVDDPFTFGQIAAANALSDVYAMGGKPKIALNLAAFPNCLDPAILADILAGGADKVKEAGAVLAGGHSISSDEPLYGLAVTGFVNPAAMWKNAGARAGDALILTKQIGTGVVNTAFKGEAASDASEAEAIHVMRSLNAKARDVLAGFSVHACTDITGFGLIGHSLEMARAGGVTLEIRARSVPLITGAADYAEEGFVPAGAYRNRDYMQDCVDEGKISRTLTDLLYDPQTSGGLLFAVSDEDVPDIMHALAGAGMETKTALVGHAVKAQTKAIRLR